jgi:hypothetical protein
VKQSLVVFALALASISLIAQPPTPPLNDLNADQQKAVARMSADQKTEVAEKMLATMNLIDPNECSANNVAISLFCKSSAKNFAEANLQDLMALLREADKPKFKAATDAILKRRADDIQRTEDRLEKMSDDELKSEAEEAKNAIEAAQNIVDHITDQASFDEGFANLTNMGLLPKGSTAAVYSPELIANLKQSFTFSGKKFDEALTQLKNKRPWWERFAPIALIAFFRSLWSAKRNKEKKAREAYFTENASRFGLSASDYGARFSLGGVTYTVDGIYEPTQQVFALAGKKSYRLDPEIVRNALALMRSQEAA